MDNYTQTYVKQGLTTLVKDGVQLNSVSHSYTATISKDTNIQGTKLMKVIQLSDVIASTISSKTDALLFSYILQNCKKHNIVVRKSTSKPATADYLANHFGVTVQKVRSFIRKATSSLFLVKVKGKYLVNPYIVVPYSKRLSTVVNDQLANQLQLWWTSDRVSDPVPNLVTMEADQLVSISSVEFLAEV